MRCLIADPLSPRSLRYALDEIARALSGLAAAVPHEPPISLSSALTSALESARSGSFDFDSIAMVSAIEAECDRIHRTVYDTYIDHRRPRGVGGRGGNVDYTVTHVTQFLYRGPVHESVMELRLGPRHDSRQEVQSFHLTTNPATTIFQFTDALGNNVHHFDIGPPHQQLDIQTRMQVRTSPTQDVPDQLDPSAWDTLERLRANGQLWDFFEPSPRVSLSAAVRAFADKCDLGRERDPLTLPPSHRCRRLRFTRVRA